MLDAFVARTRKGAAPGRGALNIQSIIKSLQPANPLFWLLAIIGMTVVVYGLLFLVPPKALIDPDGWQTVGAFREDGQFPSDKAALRLTKRRYPEIQLWGSWADGKPHTGRLSTTPFQAPPSLSFYVTGYPNNPGQGLHLVNHRSGEIFSIQTRAHGPRWKRLRVAPPESWVGQPVRLEAVDGSPKAEGWLGISTPFADDWRFHLGKWLVVPCFLTSLWLLLMPGLWVAARLQAKGWMDEPLILLAGFLSGFLICYVVFWIYFLHPMAGRGASLLLMAASVLACLHPSEQQRLIRVLALKDVKQPLMLVVSAGLFYLMLLYSVDLPNALIQHANARYLHWLLPGDNMLPYRLANIFYFDYPPKPFYLQWLSSDRPPLQASVFLFQRPLSRLWADPAMHYQALSALCQLCWLPAVWALGRRMRLSGPALHGVLGFCLFSGFFMLNTVFTWPKLMAASCLVAAYCLWFGHPRQKDSFQKWRTLLGGMAAMLGLLSHGGIFFTLLPMALALLLPAYFPGWRSCARGILAAFLLYAPWWAYQHFVDPPGTQLLKWHLAAQSRPDKRSVWETIRDRYAALTWGKYWHNKKENLKCLLGGKGLSKPTLDRRSINQRKLRGFNHTLRALGVLNVGWLTWSIAGLWFRRSRSPGTRHTWRHADLMLGITLLSALVWILLMFKPYSTKIHQGSYANMIFLFVGLAATLCRFRWIAIPLFGIQLFYFYEDWMAFTPAKGILIPPLAVASAIMGLALICVLCYDLLPKIRFRSPHANHL